MEKWDFLSLYIVRKKIKYWIIPPMIGAPLYCDGVLTPADSERQAIKLRGIPAFERLAMTKTI